MKVQLDQLSGVLVRQHAKNMDRIDRGLIRAAKRGKAHMVKVTPTDQGQLRNSWQAQGRLLRNDAPHAGIVELGARPHGVNNAGMLALIAWAKRHGASTEKEAKAMAWGIAMKLRRVGQRATHFVRNELVELTKIAKVEVEVALKKGPK
jgi:hypothetical protein